MANESLGYLAIEAAEQGMSYGQLVASITPAERARIINEQEKKAERRRRVRAVEKARRRNCGEKKE